MGRRVLWDSLPVLPAGGAQHRHSTEQPRQSAIRGIGLANRSWAAYPVGDVGQTRGPSEPLSPDRKREPPHTGLAPGPPPPRSGCHGLRHDGPHLLLTARDTAHPERPDRHTAQQRKRARTTEVVRALLLLRCAQFRATGSPRSTRKRDAYLLILVTWPAPTVRPPSRMANFRPSSIATGWMSSTVISVLSPGMTISVPSGRVTTPVTSVVRK